MYHIRKDGCVIRDADQATIPPDPANSDYAEYLQWVAAGNTATPVEEPDYAWIAYQASAKTALDCSDITVLRCYENDVRVPTAWATYRATLRAIVAATTGDATQPLPTQPDYPAGT